MKKFLLCLISVAFVACNKDIDEQNELLPSGSEVSANASISLQKEMENQNSLLIESFLKKEQLFAQEVQTLRGRKTFTEEIAREKLMPLVKESVYLLNFFGMSNEEIVQNFGSLNDPRIALAGTLITTLEKEKNKGGDISESKFWDCAQEVVGFKVINEERHEKFKEIRTRVTLIIGWFRFGGYGSPASYLNIGSSIAEFIVCMFDKINIQTPLTTLLHPYSPIDENDPYSFIGRPLILGKHLVTFKLKNNPSQRVLLLKKEIKYNKANHSFEIEDNKFYNLFKYINKSLYVGPYFPKEIGGIQTSITKDYILHIDGYYPYTSITGNQIDKNSISEEDIDF